ncbi:MAG: circadian clock protein KaiC [Bacteroidota bacterium]
MKRTVSTQSVNKVPTGIKGLDEITYGGLPQARPTLVTGYAGSGKTVLAMQFILNGIEMYDEPGVYISMEETEEDLRRNMATFGYDLEKMESANKLSIENIKVRHSALYKSGHFDLSPIFIRIEEAIDKVGATRLAVDTFELIFTDIQDENIFRQELVRLILWLKERNLTVIFTSELPQNPHVRSGIEEFITDCVISLKHEMIENIYTRRLHIVKYRGSKHGTNEYPFLIEKEGISILPITSVEESRISSDIISTGIRGLDDKIEKKGFYVGSSTLISGASGVGKTSFSISVCMQAMKQKRRSLFFSFEESVPQLKRNMKSIGFDLDHYEKKGLLKIISTRPSLFGLEAHLVLIYHYIDEFDPEVVIFDPVTDLIQVGPRTEVRGMLLRIIDYLKSKLVTIVLTALVSFRENERNLGISSLVDNWLFLDTIKSGRNREQSIRITKIRGMNHTRMEYILEFTPEGLQIKDIIEE